MYVLFHSTFFFVVLNPTIQLLILAITYGTDLHDIKVYYTFSDQSKIYYKYIYYLPIYIYYLQIYLLFTLFVNAYYLQLTNLFTNVLNALFTNVS